MMLIKSTVQKISVLSGTMLLLFLFPAICKAGGDSFLFEIQSLQSKGNNQYKLTLKCLEEDANCGRSNRMIIHLRFNKSAFGKQPFRELTQENYLKCIEKLKEQTRKGGSFRFGFMGVGIYRISGKKDEYQSNGLAELKENDGNVTIYSFANPI